MQQRKVDYRSRMCGAANKALTRTEGGKSIPHPSCESEQGIRSQWAQLRRLVNGSRDQSSREDALHYCSSLHADWGSTDIEWVDVNWCSLGKRCRFTFSRKTSPVCSTGRGETQAIEKTRNTRYPFGPSTACRIGQRHPVMDTSDKHGEAEDTREVTRKRTDTSSLLSENRRVRMYDLRVTSDRLGGEEACWASKRRERRGCLSS